MTSGRRSAATSTADCVQIVSVAVDLSILIPARNEMFLGRTVADILAHAEGATEIIVVLDGAPALDPLPADPRVRVIEYSDSIGQRAATNAAALASQAKYIMKVDAHCAFDQGFDVKLMAPYESGEIGMDTTTIPRMYNLHVFNWVCQVCGQTTYQGPRPERCAQCGHAEHKMDIVWTPRWSRCSDFARFDSTLHFQYWGEYKKRPAAQGDIADVMSSVGACWLMPRARFWELGGLDERHGSWGQMGTEIACKSWLSGGRQVVNKRTWFAHLFRTQPGFGFPYPLSGDQVERARAHSRWLWAEGHWEKAVHPLSWLINKFAPVPDWDASKGIVYYTDNRLDPLIAQACQRQLDAAAGGRQIVSVSLQPLAWAENIVLPLERGYLTMFRQILAGIEASRADVIFLAEHDVLYPRRILTLFRRARMSFITTKTCGRWTRTAGARFFTTRSRPADCALIARCYWSITAAALRSSKPLAATNVRWALSRARISRRAAWTITGLSVGCPLTQILISATV